MKKRTCKKLKKMRIINQNQINRFAMELLVPDSLLEEYREFTVEQISRLTGYHQKLIQLRVGLNRSEIPNS